MKRYVGSYRSRTERNIVIAILFGQVFLWFWSTVPDHQHGVFYNVYDAITHFICLFNPWCR